MMVFSTLSRRFRDIRQAKIYGALLVSCLPLLSQGQTTIVNYDFNAGTTYPTTPAATAPGVTSAVTGSQPFATVTGGTTTGAGAFTTNNVAGNALNMSNSGGTGKYFEFSLSGTDLPKYSAFKLYLQSQRSNTGATAVTLQYSVNGGAYVPFAGSCSPGNGVFTEGSFDLTSLTALNAPTTLAFRLLASGASSTGALRIDNFQVQAVNAVDPTISSLTPATTEAGSPDFVLTVGGSNFQSGATVTFKDQPLSTTFISATSLTALVPAAAVASIGSYAVTVTNPAAGSATTPSAPINFLVTPALPHWTGKASTSSWFDAANWSTGAVPGTTDEVLLDHRDLAGSYTVNLDQNITVSIKSLTIKPGAGDSIFVVVPIANTTNPPLTLSNTGAGAVALAIYSKGVLTNASGAASGSGIDVAGTTGATAFLYNGGSYRHASRTGHAGLAGNLSAVAGTELGIFDFRLPTNGPSSYAVSVSGRTYGTLIFRNRPGQAASNYAGSGGSLTVRGNLIIGPNVTLTTTLSDDLAVSGDLRAQGKLQVNPPVSPLSLVSKLLLTGTKPQTLSGTISLISFNTTINATITAGLAINNSAGVTLATPIVLGAPLTLTSGVLTTSATSLLTMTSTASLTGGNAASYVSGPLARQTAAGAVTNLVFPTGSGAAYRPVVLNATAQDATTYLVTQREGPAPDFGKLLPGTSALPALTRVSRVRAYTITPTPAANNFSGTVTLSFGADDQVDAPTDAGFVVGKNSGPGWENIGSSNVSIVTPAPPSGYLSGTITSGPFTSFSDFALARTNAEAAPNPLPVTLTRFAARREATDVSLSWATASELNNSQFEVQRSQDGQLFTSVAFVAGHGTSAQPHAYAARDQAAPAGTLYYRLAQTDTNGHSAFGPVVTLAAAARTTSLAPYPNPAHERLTVPAPTGTLVQVLDLTGRVRQTSALPPSGELALLGLPAGSYLLRAADGRVWRFNKE